MAPKFVFPTSQSRRMQRQHSEPATSKITPLSFETDPLLTFASSKLAKPEVSTQPHRETRATISQVSVRYRKLNGYLAVFVAASAPISALFVGLNRPILWLIWGVVTAFAAILYFELGKRYEPKRALILTKLPRWSGMWLFGLAACIPIFAIAQAVPLASMVEWGVGWPTATSQTILTPRYISLLPEASLLASLRICFYIIFYLLAIEVAGRLQRATKIGWWVFLGGVAHAVWALVALRVLGDVSLWGPKVSYEGMATGAFVNRNSLATFLGMTACLGLALVLDNRNHIGRRCADKYSILNTHYLENATVWLGLGVILLALVATQSRMGVFATGVGLMICWTLMTFKSGARLFRVALGVFAVVIVGGSAFVAISGLDLIERAIFVSRDAGGRLQGYAFAVELIQSRPFSGYGFEAFRPAFELVHRPPLPVATIWDRGHSTYLTYWVEMGVIVGSIPIILGGLVCVRLIILVRRRVMDFALSVAALSALCLGAVHSLVDFSLEMPATVILLLTLLGLGVAPRVDPGARPSTNHTHSGT